MHTRIDFANNICVVQCFCQIARSTHFHCIFHLFVFSSLSFCGLRVFSRLWRKIMKGECVVGICVTWTWTWNEWILNYQKRLSKYLLFVRKNLYIQEIYICRSICRIFYNIFFKQKKWSNFIDTLHLFIYEKLD